MYRMAGQAIPSAADISALRRSRRDRAMSHDRGHEAQHVRLMA
jgi:hypothetical protein